MVPVLNEERAILRTLERLAAQDEIDEIVVVDNGSTDRTLELLEEFAAAEPRLIIVHEPQRGLAIARNAGYNKAGGDIIARTDGDTLVAPDWAETIVAHLESHPETAAVTGLTYYYDSPVGWLLELGYRIQLRRGRFRGQVGNVHGPNHALRRTVWEQIRDETKTRPDVIEDLDLALCLTKRGLRIELLPEMKAWTSARRRRTDPSAWWRFQLTGLRTIAGQGYDVRALHRGFIVWAWVAHTAQWPLYRFWDFERRRFTLRGAEQRISSIGE
ncbi:glycosyltransferase family 2 protein [Nocardia inohanensis]|uniref:glycosyltransferase family 2 protein n=1 Tax=Nocardia inohanensis TaxID=209246 RepID=UPI001FE099EB|nr:glycosyltransferase family 2 protein [Nocardia inohanensis]